MSWAASRPSTAAMADNRDTRQGLGPNGTAGLVTHHRATGPAKIMGTMTFKQAKYQQTDPHFLSWVQLQLRDLSR